MQDVHIIAGSSTSLPFLLVQSSDHTTPAVTLAPEVYVSHDAGGFVRWADPIELGNGWYALPGSAALSGVVGPLILHAEAEGADPVDIRYEVVPAPGVCPLVVNSGRYPLTFLLIDSDDHITGATGLVPTVTIAKPGGAFAAPVGTVAEIGTPPHVFGWYAVAPDASDVDTPGPLLLHAYGNATDLTDEKYDVTGTTAVPNYALTNSLLAIQALIINSGLFTANTCIVSFAQEPFPNPSPPCCAISYRGFSFDQGYATGGGRYMTEAEGEFVVRFILRHASDIASQDVLFMTNAARGAMPFVEQTINALNEQFLFDPYGTMLTSCGLKLGNVAEPRPYGRDPMIGQIAVTLKARVVLSLSLPDP